MARVRSYPSDVGDEEWAFVAPYLTLYAENAAQRRYSLRSVFNALRYLTRTGCGWRYLPHDLPPWQVVYQQWTRWRDNRCFESMTTDLRELLRLALGRQAETTAVILDSRTLQSTRESGARAGYDGAKRRKGSKVHLAVDTLGHLLAAYITPANEQDRAQVAALCAQVQAVTGGTVEVAWADQGYTGEATEQAADEQGVVLQVVKRPEGSKGFVLLPRRWVVERSFSWLARFRRLARDYERLAVSLQQFHFVAAVILMLAKAVKPTTNA